MCFIGQGDWLLAHLFMLGNIGVYGAFTFCDSLLPHIASTDEVDRVRQRVMRSATWAACCSP
jgi:hypothetical protein